MQIFFDTNVLISAFMSRGLCTDLFRLALEKHSVLLSELVLAELEEVLQKKFHAGKEFIKEVKRILSSQKILKNSTSENPFTLDKNDSLILASALSGGAEVFVTGDKAILVLSRVEKLKIMDPRTLWNFLKSFPS